MSLPTAHPRATTPARELLTELYRVATAAVDPAPALANRLGRLEREPGRRRWILALGNDVGYDQIFVQQLMNYGSAGDVVIAISGSGNSPNVLRAVEWANAHGMKTYGCTGFSGGKLRTLAQSGLHVPLDDMGMVESIHLCLFHWVLNDVYARINREGRYSTS